MWPTLEIGNTYEVRARGRRRSRRAILLAVDDLGTLVVAMPPRSPRGCWRPWAVTRQDVLGVFSGA